MLTNRVRAILELLIANQEDLFTTKRLANIFEVSERSIRNDLDLIDEFLEANDLGNMQKKTKTIISLPNHFKQSKIDMKKMVELIDPSHFYHTLEERIELIYIEILMNPKPVKVDPLIELLQVSRSTVLSDIGELKDNLAIEQIELKTDHQKGYYFSGNENSIRKHGLMLISQNPYLRYRIEENLQNGYWENFSDEQIKFLEQLIYKMEDDLNISFSGNAFINLLFGLYIFILRMKQQNYSEDIKEKISAGYHENREYHILLEYVDSIEEIFQIDIPDYEVWYLVNLFQEGNLIESEQYLDKNWVDLYLFTNQFIEEMSQKLGVRLIRDPELFRALVLHLGPAFNRARNETYLKNEIIDYIEDSYPELFELVQETISERIGERMIEFNADEIGFITLHVASALEKISSNYKMNVMLVCNHGIGTSQLLKNRIDKHLSFNVVSTITSREVTSELMKANHIDLIISTVSIDTNPENPVEIVSPLLSNDEILRLKKLEVTHSKISGNELNYIENVLKGDEPMLVDLLNENVVDVDVDIDHWEQAVRYGGEMLKNENIITQEYVETMVNTVKDLGPYIVIAPGIAMPHASSKDGVNEIGISLFTLEEPVEFGNKENDPVDIVVTLAAVDHTSHLKALGELVSYLNDDEIISAIKKAETKEDILTILNVN